MGRCRRWLVLLGAWVLVAADGGCAQGGGPGEGGGRAVPDAGGSEDGGVRDGGPRDARPGDASRPPDTAVPRDCVDLDRDGYGRGPDCLGPDCNDGDPSIHPGAAETCDGRDEDCSGTEDDGTAADECPLGPGVASASCTLGVCGIGACSEGLGDCDGDPSNGCETDVQTSLEHCGGCGMPCSLPNAEVACMASSCTFVQCLDGFGDCDGDPSNGCERTFEMAAGDCGGAPNVGTYDGDTKCGFLCGGNGGWDRFATRMGNGSAWFRARVREDSNCSARIEHRVILQVPAGTNYDLFVYRGCGGAPVGSSTRGEGEQEQVVVAEGDSFGSDDDFDYWVEVRLVSGSPCDAWTLRFEGHNC